MDIEKAVAGMCANPFGGHLRLDKLDLIALADGKSEPLEMVLRQTILDAVSCYLFFGLGRNGYVAQEFIWAHDYFFEVKSTNSETWNPERHIRVSDIKIGHGHGKNQDKRFHDMTDADIKVLCFDEQWILSGLDRAMGIGQFRRLLRQKRRNIVEANFDQVRDYLRSIRNQAASRGEHLRPGTYQGDLLETLVSPTDESLASLLYPLKQIAQVSHRSPFRLPRRICGHRDWKAARKGCHEVAEV